MKITDLPEEVTRLFADIPDWQDYIRDSVVDVLLKFHWERETGKEVDLSPAELQMLINPPEVAAIWAIRNQTTVKTDHVKVVRRAGRIKPAVSWGSGPGKRHQYTVESVKDIEVTHQRGRPKGENPQKYPSWTSEYRREKSKQEEDEAA